LFPITGNTFSRPERQSKYQKEGAVGLSEVRKKDKVKLFYGSNIL
jgi:hypothetical protein